MFEGSTAWIRKHRKRIITTSVIGFIGGVAVLIINGKNVKIPLAEVAMEIIAEVPAPLSEVAEDITIVVDGVTKTFPRSPFLRQLYPGWQASPQKIAQAAEMGISLNPGETLVNACNVTIRAA